MSAYGGGARRYIVKGYRQATDGPTFEDCEYEVMAYSAEDAWFQVEKSRPDVRVRSVDPADLEVNRFPKARHYPILDRLS